MERFVNIAILGYQVFDDHIVTSVRLSTQTTPDVMTLVLKYYLPQSFSPTNGYSLYLYKQAGMLPFPATVSYNGKSVEKEMTQDEEFKL